MFPCCPRRKKVTPERRDSDEGKAERAPWWSEIVTLAKPVVVPWSVPWLATLMMSGGSIVVYSAMVWLISGNSSVSIMWLLTPVSTVTEKLIGTGNVYCRYRPSRGGLVRCMKGETHAGGRWGRSRGESGRLVAVGDIWVAHGCRRRSVVRLAEIYLMGLTLTIEVAVEAVVVVAVALTIVAGEVALWSANIRR